MKRRIMAIAVVFLMLATAFGAATTDSSGSSTVTDLGTAVPDGNGSTVTKTFTTTEGMFGGYGYTVRFFVADVGENGTSDITSDDVSWSGLVYGTRLPMGGSVSDWTDFSNGTEKFNAMGFQITLAKDGGSESYPAVLGKYTLTLQQTNDVLTPTTVAVKAVLETDNISGGKTEQQSTYYILEVGRAVQQVQMYISDISIGNGYVNILPEAYSDEGRTASIKHSDYSWYAIGLPAGLSMSSAGYITGICTETSAGSSDDVKIVAVDKDGNYHLATVGVSWPAYKGISLKVTDGEGRIIGDGSTNVVLVKSELKIVAELENATSGKVSYDITVIDGSTGELSKNVGFTDYYALPTSGTGSYRVVVNATDSGGSVPVQYTTMFYVYVMPVFEDLEAHIGVASA